MKKQPKRLSSSEMKRRFGEDGFNGMLKKMRQALTIAATNPAKASVLFDGIRKEAEGNKVNGMDTLRLLEVHLKGKDNG